MIFHVFAVQNYSDYICSIDRGLLDATSVEVFEISLRQKLSWISTFSSRAKIIDEASMGELPQDRVVKCCTSR